MSAYRMAALAMCFVWMFPTPGNAQLYVPVFPDLSGQLLLDSVVWKFKPILVLPYSIARDTLYSRIYNVNDSVRCVYTGHRLYLPPGEDPTQALYLNGSPNGITNEHTWPQSFGAETGNPLSDMHHLYPSRAAVNDARGNLRFAEIPDNLTDTWFLGNTAQSVMPGASNIDQYSEKNDDAFEPREDHKGNVARAMFYFYTMYRNEADMANPDYFWEQRETLCNWHYADPVDEAEYERTWKIAAYQNQRPNPFVIDCSLAGRSWCSEVPGNCSELPLPVQAPDITSWQFRLFPNPAHGQTVLEISSPIAARISITLIDPFGRTCWHVPEWPVVAGISTLMLEMLSPGMYYVQIATGQYPVQYKKIISL